MEKPKSQKFVFAHFMIGNTYPYRSENFELDISEAISTEIDGFALNIGDDEWTPSRIETMFSVARSFPHFKLFFSFDMSIIASAELIVDYLLRYANHPNSFYFKNRYFVSTFAGENQSFGHIDVNSGWEIKVKQPLKQQGLDIYFVPSWTGYDAWDMFHWFPVVDGAFSWAAWFPTVNPLANVRPYPDTDTPSKYDLAYTQTARRYLKTYMAGLSPCFFAHFPWKNWVYPDLTLLVRRFRELIRLQPDLIQVISWNGMHFGNSIEIDWGESHYIGTQQKEAGIPNGAEKWINGFDHEPWREICRYFIHAYKTGRFREITEDRLIFWYPPHLNSYSKICPEDPLACPAHAQRVQTKLVVVVFLKEGENEVILESGGHTQAFPLSQGFHMLEIDLQAGRQLVKSRRKGKDIMEGTGDIEVRPTPENTWNYNPCVFRGKPS